MGRVVVGRTQPGVAHQREQSRWHPWVQPHPYPGNGLGPVVLSQQANCQGGAPAAAMQPPFVSIVCSWIRQPNPCRRRIAPLPGAHGTPAPVRRCADRQTASPDGPVPDVLFGHLRVLQSAILVELLRGLGNSKPDAAQPTRVASGPHPAASSVQRYRPPRSAPDTDSSPIISPFTARNRASLMRSSARRCSRRGSRACPDDHASRRPQVATLYDLG